MVSLSQAVLTYPYAAFDGNKLKIFGQTDICQHFNNNICTMSTSCILLKISLNILWKSNLNLGWVTLLIYLLNSTWDTHSKVSQKLQSNTIDQKLNFDTRILWTYPSSLWLNTSEAPACLTASSPSVVPAVPNTLNPYALASCTVAIPT